MANMQLSSSTALAVRDPWALVPSLGNLDAYISAVNRLPMLSAEEETRLARRLRDQQDLDAAGRLVLSHLRLVVSVARQYLGYGLPQGDLIQEGNVGLMKAVKRFDPDQGVRLVSYALHWIKAEIDRVAAELNVRREDVIEMETRFAGGDVALEPGGDDDDESFAPIAYLADDRQEPTRAIEARRRDELAGPGLLRALDALDARSRRIVEERWLKVNDDGSGGMTLHELAAEYGVSAERIRQIEVAAMKKMKKALAAYA